MVFIFKLVIIFLTYLAFWLHLLPSLLLFYLGNLVRKYFVSIFFGDFSVLSSYCSLVLIEKKGSFTTRVSSSKNAIRSDKCSALLLRFLIVACLLHLSLLYRGTLKIIKNKKLSKSRAFEV